MSLTKLALALTVTVLAHVPTLAHAATDYTCVSTCTASGKLYGLCQSQCSYPDNPVVAPTKTTDFTCVSQCTSSGNLYGLCVNRCSF